jgi:hypothetical protein
MQQVKIFKSVEPEVDQLEGQINVWLRESKVRVLSVVGNIAPQSSAAEPKAVASARGFAPSDVLVIVLYETT